MKIDLSIIILSFNTLKITQRSVLVLLRNLRKNKKLASEVVVLDNASSDGSVQMLQALAAKNKEIKLITNQKNVGFAKGNNQALKIARGKYILYFNSDVLVQDVDFSQVLGYCDKNKEVGGLTVKVVLPDGNIDPASHRGFPNLSNSIFYFLGLEKLTKKIVFLNKIFGGYHLAHLDLNKIHEIDAPTGAFFLSRKDILNRLGGFDEAFFFYGEDIDLAFRIKKLGYKVIYYPKFKVLHLKHASSGTGVRYHFYDAMKIFYRKHYQNHNPTLVNKVVEIILDTLKSKYGQNRN